MKKNKVIIGTLVLLPLGIGLVSTMLTGGNMDLYGQITSPPLAPPRWLFPIAWTILYLLMGIACAIIYNSDSSSPAKKYGLMLHGVQLVFNFFWSILFFNMKSYLLAFIWLVALWISVYLMIMMYKKVSKIAYLLSIPYLCWLCFAGYLNLMIFILN